jgi:eukaryotic translation initiation factor 2C
MVAERIKAYVSKAKNAPIKIIFYRYGGSNAQFAEIRDKGLPQIKAAFKAVCTGFSALKVTVIVAVKRHRTRIYPATSQEHKNGNYVPRTLVDLTVVSPHYSEFFLQSHHGLQGTTIPTHYVVIANETGHSDNALQDLTWKLCYSYVRATIGVSYAPPAYYADRLVSEVASTCATGSARKKTIRIPKTDSPGRRRLRTLKSMFSRLLLLRSRRSGRNASKKSGAQIENEQKHHKRVEGLVETAVLAQAQKCFDEVRQGGGPWYESLDPAMFWM